ncbi:hypothetical protein CRV04_04760 [Candidatus Marinarcus aquaticus]|uniref:Uncharacterized protein n=2 Tax=Candidatus Marinarcus aquaticus TaxID=2044504 RepID=A0A4Q0XSG7_9BACT|nr:hypothetical protein CRV04_04760 [Candidatus Marinarcus aquaticus]
MDLTASQTAKYVGLSRQTINHYYKIMRAALPQEMVDKPIKSLSVGYMIIQNQAYFYAKQEENYFYIEMNSSLFNDLYETYLFPLTHHTKANCIRLIYNAYTQKYISLGYFRHDLALNDFISTRLKKFRGLKKESHALHFKESILRFNHTQKELQKMLSLKLGLQN